MNFKYTMGKEVLQRCMISLILVWSWNLFRCSILYLSNSDSLCHLKEIQEAQEKSKSTICFSSVTPESSSRVTSLWATISCLCCLCRPAFRFRRAACLAEYSKRRRNFVLGPSFKILDKLRKTGQEFRPNIKEAVDKKKRFDEMFVRVKTIQVQIDKECTVPTPE